MSKREGSDTGPEPKRARTDDTVEVPVKFLQKFLRTTNLHDDEWDDLLGWLPKQSVDKLLPQLDPEHYLRRLFEREEREKVINELNSLGPTRLLLNEDASELTLTLPESFQNIFEEPLQQNVTLRRSMHKVDDAFGKWADESVDPAMPEERVHLFYFTEINPVLTTAFRKMVKYAESFIDRNNFEDNFDLNSNTLALKFGQKNPNQIGIAITFNEGKTLEQYQNCLIVHFSTRFHTSRERGLPLRQQAASDLSNVVTRLSTLEGIYGREFIEREKQRRDYLTSWDLFPSSDPNQPLLISFKGGLQSLFSINGISGAMSGASLTKIDETDYNVFEAQNLPQNLTIDVQRFREIESEVGRGTSNFRNRIDLDLADTYGTLFIFGNKHFTEYLRFDLKPTDNSERWNVVGMKLFIKWENVLSTWWQYAKDDPEEVVNAAASRRQDLLGM